MDWKSLVADEDLIMGVHLTPGRQGHAIDRVYVHNMGGNLTGRDCHGIWQDREASAHYCVDSDGRVTQTVWDRDVAWHAHNWPENQRSIGVEHANSAGPNTDLTEACLDAGAHLVAAICLYYELGRPAWLGNVFPHCYASPTDCPGPLREGHSQHDEYVRRAGEWYDRMASGEPDQRDHTSAVDAADKEDKVLPNECLIQPDGKPCIWHVTPAYVKALTHPDQMRAVQDVYRRNTGRDIPVYAYGSEDAPWAQRLLESYPSSCVEV